MNQQDQGPASKKKQDVPLMQIGVDRITFGDLVDGLSESLLLLTDLGHRHHFLIAGVRLCRIANTFVRDEIRNCPPISNLVSTLICMSSSSGCRAVA